MEKYDQMLETAVQAALRGGSHQRCRFSTRFSVSMKGEKDLVTEVDRESEALVVEHLLNRYPDHNILAEEAKYRTTPSPWRWIIDPIDGTTNYAHGFPHFCVSIGLEKDGAIVAGVVYNPMADELFTATLGGGAFLNGRRLAVSSHAPLCNTLLGTGFPYDCASDPANNFTSFIAFQKVARGIRRAGAAALDLAYVAAGRLDGYWELKLKPWDLAAGMLLVTESGGRVTNFDGEHFDITQNRIVASNGLIHDEMVAMLKSSCPGGTP